MWLRVVTPAGSTAQRAQPVDLQSAGSQPGPGSYSVGAQAKTWLEREFKDAPAPFSTTVERSVQAHRRVQPAGRGAQSSRNCPNVICLAALPPRPGTSSKAVHWPPAARLSPCCMLPITACACRFGRRHQSSSLGPGSYNTEHLSLKEGLAQRQVNAAKHGGFGVGARWRLGSTARAETVRSPVLDVDLMPTSMCCLCHPASLPPVVVRPTVCHALAQRIQC